MHLQTELVIKSKPMDLDLLTLDVNNRHKAERNCKIAGMDLTALIDSGAAVNTVTEQQFERLMRVKEFHDKIFNVVEGSSLNLKAYAQAVTLKVIATFVTEIWFSQRHPPTTETFYVVRNASRALVSLATATLHDMIYIRPDDFLKGYSEAFKDKTILHVDSVDSSDKFPKFAMDPVKINVDKSVPPSRKTYNAIERAYEEKTEERLQQMLSSDIIEKVVNSMNTDFCSVLLAVPKGLEDFRLVVDLRGPNKCIMRSPHRMPTLEDIMSKLHNSTIFSNLDLTNGFFHVELDKDSRHVTNFFTSGGMFRYKRLPFGLCNAPDIFQEAMEKILEGCEGVLIYLDDILVYGKDRDEHDKRYLEAMKRLSKHNVRINNKKSKVGVTSCTFLGFLIDKDGYHITDERLEHIHNFRKPENLKELQSFLGLMNFVDKSILNRADKTETLQEMVRSKIFDWTDKAEAEFIHLKSQALKTIKTLGFYSADDRLELYVDASPIGLGAILIQRDKEDTPRIIACASKVLTATERRYPQTQREALSVVWGTERFRFYLLGNRFTVFTDAEANEFLFNEGHRIGKRAITRAESWTLRLQPFDFEVKHVTSEGNLADSFSRLIKESQPDGELDNDAKENFDSNPGELRLFAIEEADSLLITYDELGEATEKDGDLQRIIGYVKTNEWPSAKVMKSDKVASSFYPERRNLKIVGDFLAYKFRFVVPESLKQKCLQLCHRGHLGGKSMKHIVKESFWWPKINKAVEKHAADCVTCKLITPAKHPIPYVSRPLPDGPMDIVQIDFLYIPECGSQEFLVIKDTYSRYFWCLEMKSTNMKATNAALEKVFAIWGHPRIIISDNGPPFQSEHFSKYWHDKGIEHRMTVPYCPEMNGMVENKNQGILRAIRAAKAEGKSWKTALSEYCDMYNHVTPHSTTNVTPFELLAGRKFRGFFPDLYTQRTRVSHEELAERDALAKAKSIAYANERVHAKESDIKAGDWVYVPVTSRKSKTDGFFHNEPFQVVSRQGPRLYLIGKEGEPLSRCVSQVKKAGEERLVDFEPNEVVVDPAQADRVILNTDPRIPNNEVIYDSQTEAMDTGEHTQQDSDVKGDDILTKAWKINDSPEVSSGTSVSKNKGAQIVITRSGRVSRPPKRFQNQEQNNLETCHQTPSDGGSRIFINLF